MISTSTNYPLPVALFLFLTASVISFYFYKNSQLPKAKKYFLMGLKALAIFLILVLFIEPSLLSEKKTPITRTNVVLIDDSRSNELISPDKTTKESQLKNQLKNWTDNENSKFYSFSNVEPKEILASEPDTLKFQGYETNLNEALTNIKKISPQTNFNSVSIISDGCFNAGGNPLYKLKEFNCPVFTFGIGDTIQQRDIVVEKVLFNEKSFINTKNIFKVLISVFGLNNENITVSLEREGIVIATKNVTATRPNQTIETEFDITESKTGTVKYRINAEKKAGEVTYKNNSYDFLVKYVDNKINILYISSGPGYDNSFILEILKRVNNYNITTRVLRNQNEFYEGQIDLNKFGDLSLIFLLGFPTVQVNNGVLENIISRSKEFNIPIMFFSQKNTDYKMLEKFNDFIPFSISKSSNAENLISLKSTGTDVLKENISGIDNTPQIFKNVSGIIPKAGSIVLATDKQTGEPILITRNSEGVKSTAFLGYGLWRWKLNEKLNDEKIAESFILGIINETISRDKKEKLNIIPAKSIFDYTENIMLNAEVFENNYLPVSSAKIKGDILKNGIKVNSVVDFSWTNNSYSATLPPLPPGDYIIEAQAFVDNNSYATSSARFLVDTIKTEYLVTKSDYDLLRTISQNTGGEFLKANESFGKYKEMISNIEKQNLSKEYTSAVKFNLWANKYVLVFIILLFSVEWFMRKRNNIP